LSAAVTISRDFARVSATYSTRISSSIPLRRMDAAAARRMGVS